MYKEICPKCGGNINSSILLSYPPIYKKSCSKCNQIWTKKEKIEDKIFNPEDWETTQRIGYERY
jgi:reverse gyrase